MYKNEVFVRLVITSTLKTPNEISTVLGMKPHKNWEINTPKTKESNVLHRYNLWEVHLKKDNILDTEPLLEQLITFLKPIKSNIVQLLDVEKEVSVVIYKEKNLPAIHYNSEIISFINDINASLDIDIYEIVF